MRLELSRSSFIKQFPFLRLAIIQEYDERDTIFVEGEIADNEDPLLKKFPDVINIFTKREIAMLKNLYSKNGVVPRSELLYLTPSSNSNIIDVHIKSIRRKMEQHKLPFTIKTYRGMGYMLIKA